MEQKTGKEKLNMEQKTHWKKIVSDPTYIGEADFEPNEEKILTIASINSKETVQTAEGKSQKAVVHWVEKEKAMILNVARSKAIQKATGSPWMEDWVGKKVQLYIDNKVKAFGEIVSAVRVRPFAPKAVEKEVFYCENCGQEIKGSSGFTAEQIIAGSVKKFGKKLCVECAVAEADKAKAEKKE